MYDVPCTTVVCHEENRKKKKKKKKLEPKSSLATAGVANGLLCSSSSSLPSRFSRLNVVAAKVRQSTPRTNSDLFFSFSLASSPPILLDVPSSITSYTPSAHLHRLPAHTPIDSPWLTGGRAWRVGFASGSPPIRPARTAQERRTDGVPPLHSSHCEDPVAVSLVLCTDRIAGPRWTRSDQEEWLARRRSRSSWYVTLTSTLFLGLPRLEGRRAPPPKLSHANSR